MLNKVTLLGTLSHAKANYFSFNSMCTKICLKHCAYFVIKCKSTSPIHPCQVEHVF